MITRIVSSAGERVFDGEIGRFVEPIPCHRCGVCCRRWQPLVSDHEVDRLADFLDRPAASILDEFTTVYPLDDRVRLLRQVNGGCVFLTWDADGRGACGVHPARPDACHEWTASLQRRECIDGLTGVGTVDQPLPLATLYPESDDRAAFVAVIAPEAGYGA